MSFVASTGVTIVFSSTNTYRIPIPKYVEGGGSYNDHARGYYQNMRVDALLSDNGLCEVSFDTSPSPQTIPMATVGSGMIETINIPHRAKEVIVYASGAGVVFLHFGK